MNITLSVALGNGWITHKADNYLGDDYGSK